MASKAEPKGRKAIVVTIWWSEVELEAKELRKKHLLKVEKKPEAKPS